jgi:hypothetical protein
LRAVLTRTLSCRRPPSGPPALPVFAFLAMGFGLVSTRLHADFEWKRFVT